MALPSEPPVEQIEWKPCYRIVPSRFPPISLFEQVADPADLEAVYEIEELTNDRLRDEVGDLKLVPDEDRVAGPGTSAIMAAFTHLNPAGDRFTDGSYGLFYAAHGLDTAIAETRYHRARFLARTDEPAQEVDMRVYVVDLDAQLHDIRGNKEHYASLHDPDSYAASQAFAGRLRKVESNGIAYDSVRHVGGECAAVFRPKLLSNCRQERHLCYVWDGNEIANVYEKKALEL
ncbi:MAG: RES family NAD+ phosphorylase [Pseudomonadota bacterium]